MEQALAAVFLPFGGAVAGGSLSSQRTASTGLIWKATILDGYTMRADPKAMVRGSANLRARLESK